MTSKKPQSMTAGELQAQLANDSQYQAMLAEKERKWNELEQLLQRDEESIVSECRAVGIPVNSVWELVNTDSSYGPAIPVLVDHLGREHHPRTREGIVRALITPDSRGQAFGPLEKLFLEISDGNSQLKWLVGMALTQAATEEDLDSIVELLRDRRHGMGRGELPLALVQWPKEKAEPILESLLSDKVTAKSAKKVLAVLRRK